MCLSLHIEDGTVEMGPFLVQGTTGCPAGTCCTRSPQRMSGKWNSSFVRLRSCGCVEAATGGFVFFWWLGNLRRTRDQEASCAH